MSSPENGFGSADTSPDEHEGGLVLPDGFVPRLRSRFGNETADALLEELLSSRQPANIEDNPNQAIADKIVALVPGAHSRSDENGAIIIDFGDSEDDTR